MIPLQSLSEPEWVLLAALAIDVVFGEPPAQVHPVVWLGSIVNSLVRRAPRDGVRALASGIGIAVGVPIVALGATALVHESLSPWPWLSGAFCVWMLTSCFSVRLLMREAMWIARLLEGGRLVESRARLSHLCSRNPHELREDEVAGAVIESVAENTSDSYIAPLFWFCLLGLPGALLFRAINTLDAMIGYRGEFENLGKAAARADDFMCLVPARITAVLFLLAGAVSGRNIRRAGAVLVRDRRVPLSPNAGYPMAAMAGLLDVRLTKRGEYHIGDQGIAAGPRGIRESVQILGVTSAVATALAVGALMLSE